MRLNNVNFNKNFMKITEDAWEKGWHERNGGNISYRLTSENVESIKNIIDENRDYSPIGVTVKIVMLV